MALEMRTFPLPGADAAFNGAAHALAELGNARQVLPDAARRHAEAKAAYAATEATFLLKAEGGSEAMRKAHAAKALAEDADAQQQQRAVLQAEYELEIEKQRIAHQDDWFVLYRAVLAVHAAAPSGATTTMQTTQKES